MRVSTEDPAPQPPPHSSTSPLEGEVAERSEAGGGYGSSFPSPPTRSACGATSPSRGEVKADSLPTGRVGSSASWREAKANYLTRVSPWGEERVRRMARHEKHPVYDFLFEYYSFRP